MKWKFFYDDEILTKEDQRIKENQENMNVGFWIGFTTAIILFFITYIGGR